MQHMAYVWKAEIKRLSPNGDMSAPKDETPMTTNPRVDYKEKEKMNFYTM